MSDVICRRTGQVLPSVHTPDYPESKWIIMATTAMIAKAQLESAEPRNDCPRCRGTGNKSLLCLRICCRCNVVGSKDWGAWVESPPDQT